jgi:uncharacterized protein YkwD
MQKEHCMFRRQYIIISIFLIVLGGSCSKESAEPIIVVRALSSPEVEQELLGLINAHRMSLGHASLEFSPVAYEYASAHTDYMIASGTLSHDNFSARASGISEEVNAEQVAENIARDYNTALQAFNGWLESSSHRKTMEGDFTHTAVSVKKDAQGNYYYTQLFFR